jgi:hypothetical protein
VSHAVRRRFVKNYCSPILLVQDSHFEYMLGLYEPFFGARTKLGPLLDEIRDCGSEDAFFASGRRRGRSGPEHAALSLPQKGPGGGLRNLGVRPDSLYLRTMMAKQ